MAPSHCAEEKDQFLQLSRYRQLKTAEDYQALNKDIEAQLQHAGLREAGRIFYFSATLCLCRHCPQHQQQLPARPRRLAAGCP